MAERINWTDSLLKSFKDLKEAAADPKGIYVPKQEDRLITSSDYSTAHSAIGGALHIIRQEQGKEVKLLGGHFSATLDKNQSRWLACECEALAIKRVLNHFEPEIRGSDHTTTHETDNMPSVLAWRRMLQGKFSTNPRITTFLHAILSYPVRIEHRPGSSLNISDHASRHPPSCTENNCAICIFAYKDRQDGDDLANVYNLKSNQTAPFLQLSTWLDIQKNDPTHVRLANLIRTGQGPERKRTGGEETVLKNLHSLYMKDNLKVDSNGLILIRAQHGFLGGYVISVPSNIFPGLCFAYHHKTSHPSKYQMTKLLSRYYHSTGMQSIIERVTESCLMCTSTRKLPKPLLADSTTIPSGVGTSFCSDVLERLNQRILLSKDELSHFSAAVLLEDQTAETLRQGLIQTISPYISKSGAKVRVDPAPGFHSLSQNQKDDVILQQLKLRIEVGDALNVNKNPTGESAIAELKRELLNLGMADRTLDQATLSLATHIMNSRVRAGGKTASERMMGRDIMTNSPIEVNEDVLKEELEDRRKKQHASNSNPVTEKEQKFSIGDLVMMKQMQRLDKPRDLYIVMGNEGKHVVIRRSEKQWRKRKYRVKPEQLVKVMSTDGEVSQAVADKVDDKKSNTPTSQSRSTDNRRSNRTSSKKASMGIQHGYRHGIFQVDEEGEVDSDTEKKNFKKKEINSEKFITVTFTDQHVNQPNLMLSLTNEQVPNQDPDPDPSSWRS